MLSSSGFSTRPSTRNVQLAASMAGAPKWLRTKKRSLGVNSSVNTETGVSRSSGRSLRTIKSGFAAPASDAREASAESTPNFMRSRRPGRFMARESSPLAAAGEHALRCRSALRDQRTHFPLELRFLLVAKPVVASPDDAARVEEKRSRHLDHAQHFRRFTVGIAQDLERRRIARKPFAHRRVLGIDANRHHSDAGLLREPLVEGQRVRAGDAPGGPEIDQRRPTQTREVDLR